ncbi:hypothetical protein BaRGS_00018750 [Batillaria attramentaria]|uniref:Uncharacterized protein n=1 Tax=Batillaria attramentaria TaxID=370345 RepID=A0ABD0KRW7_9CAEN
MDPGLAGCDMDPGLAGCDMDPGLAGCDMDPGLAGCDMDPGLAGCCCFGPFLIWYEVPAGWSLASASYHTATGKPSLFCYYFL